MGIETAGQAQSRGGMRGGMGASGYPPSGVPMLTNEQERVLLEHLPVVRFLARRIHERLPSMWTSKIWSRRGWWA